MKVTDQFSTTRRSIAFAAEDILGSYFPVHNHGFVALVDYMGNDEAIEQAARVAYGYGTRKESETRDLLRYLYRHKHTSPFEMVEFKFHCSMPIFVARQWIRHRTANVNEVSGRYSILPMLFYTPPPDQLRPQSTSNKQGRANEDRLDDRDKQQAFERWNEHRIDVTGNYQWFTEHDFARELARIDLPLSTYTQWYWKIDLHNLLHFLTLRVDSHAHWEIQQYGKIMAGMLKRVAPIAYEAWIDYDVCGAKLSRSGIELLQLLHTYGYEELLSDIASGVLSPGNMSTREVQEFRDLFVHKEVPNFDLDLSTAKSASFFEEQAKAAVASPSKT